MDMDYELLEEVAQLPEEQLKEYILKRARTIVSNTQGDSWDDPEDYQMDSIELAHAVYRLLKEQTAMTYFVCYDTFGNGFYCEPGQYGFAFSEDELKEVVANIIEKYNIDDSQVCIFELTNKTVKSKVKIKTIEQKVTDVTIS